MRLSSVLSEAARNVASGTSRVAAFAILLSVVLCTLSVADLASVRVQLDAARDYRNAGASVTTISAPGRVSGAACDAMTGIAGVRAAGALRAAPTDLVALALPRSGIPTFEVSPGFASVLNVNGAPSGPGVLISADVSTALDLATGDALVTRSGSTTVNGVYSYPDDGRRAGYRYAVLVPTSDPASFDECWVDAWPESRELAALIRTALIPGAPVSLDSSPPAVSQLNTRLGTHFDGASRFTTRITQYSALLAVVAGFAVGFVFVRRRRLELASALHSGVTTLSLLAILLCETAVWILGALLLMTPVLAIAAGQTSQGDSASMLWIAAAAPAAGATAAVAGVALGALLTRERQLFAYFKDR